MFCAFARVLLPSLDFSYNCEAKNVSVVCDNYGTFVATKDNAIDSRRGVFAVEARQSFSTLRISSAIGRNFD